MAALKAYDEVLKESRQHKIAGEQLSDKLVIAAKTRTDLNEELQDQIIAEEEEKERRIAAENRRAAAEAERKREADELRKLVEDKQKADEKRRNEAVSIYRKAPQSARNAINALKKVEARLEVGINFRDYSTVVGESWADVKIFIESSDGKKLPEFNMLLRTAVQDYKLAHDIWNSKIEYSILYGRESNVRDEVDSLQQKCWSQARRYIDLADSLLDPEKTAKSLETVASLPANEKDLDADWEEIRDKVLRK